MSGHPSRSEQLKLVLLRRPPLDTDRHAATSARLATTSRTPGAAAATKILTRPRWLLFHLVVWALAATFVGLGLWQLSVSDARGFDFFNFQYALQWWLFATFGLFVWIRVMQYRLNPPQTVTAQHGTLMHPDDAAAPHPGTRTLVVPGADERPIVYRGYVTPQSSRTPVRSHGDALHDAYNDYLWQLGVADGGTPDVHARTGVAGDNRRADEVDPGSTAPEIR